MRIKIDVDVTPQELRTFFGLPEVEPLQREMLEKIREKVQAGAEGLDPVSLMRPFLPPNMQSVEALQKAFWDSIAGSANKPRDESD